MSRHPWPTSLTCLSVCRDAVLRAGRERDEAQAGHSGWWEKPVLCDLLELTEFKSGFGRSAGSDWRRRRWPCTGRGQERPGRACDLCLAAGLCRPGRERRPNGVSEPAGGCRNRFAVCSGGQMSGRASAGCWLVGERVEERGTNVRRVIMWTDALRQWDWAREARRSFPASGNRSRHLLLVGAGSARTRRSGLAGEPAGLAGLGCLAEARQGRCDLDRRSVVCRDSLIDPPGARRRTGKRNGWEVCFEQGSAMVIKRGDNR